MKQVFHKKFGLGTVLAKEEKTAVIRFNHGIEECPLSEIEERLTVEDKLESNQFEDFDYCQLRTQAALIESINDSWGVFSKSNVDLLPHQLWVCNKVIQKWPFHYLIADDVGLGKTVEAGLILWPLIASGKVNRLLILTPAPLAEQWQVRMRKMFDIRLARYSKEQDTKNSDFWNSNKYVVASMPSLSQVREELREERQNRMLEADKWDLIVVDEAHHMYADEKQGETLGFQLLEKLEDANKVDSCLFFTGTPHRGKDYGFWALMRLINPDIFSEDKGNTEQYKQLKNYFIRNNKQCVMNMNGEKLFKDLNQRPMTFTYSPEETEFYKKMSEFIQEGRAYSMDLSGALRQQVQLVLISLQKIASSSIAAIRSALQTRLSKFEANFKNLEEENNELTPDECTAESDEELRNLQTVEKAFKDITFKLMQDEAKHLRELIDLADKVKEESRIKKIIDLIDTEYKGEQVLLFTEYKRTQALMIGALMDKWGVNNVGFINGDDVLPKVKLNTEREIDLQQKREATADEFNTGKIRFLVSTEAAGEGIDLQKNCHVLIHVDLPWNPMRLHQRVGRLNRYGQTKSVDVISFRNPDTIEAHIWMKLQQKLIQIEKMFEAGMDDPEDIMQLVIGMQKPEIFDDLFIEGIEKSKDNLDDWFDAKTQTLGGEKVISTVKSILGNAARFNLAGLNSVPKLDLPDLIPFFKKAVKLAGRQITSEDNIHFSFKTPISWDTDVGIKRNYENLIFKRKTEGSETPDDICGVGHKIFQKALDFSKEFKDSVCSITGKDSYYIYRVFDKITYSKGNVYNKYVVVKKAESENSIIREEDFFSTLPLLQKGNCKQCAHIKDYKFEELINEYVSKSEVIEFREPGVELFAAFIGD